MEIEFNPLIPPPHTNEMASFSPETEREMKSVLTMMQKELSKEELLDGLLTGALLLVVILGPGASATAISGIGRALIRLSAFLRLNIGRKDIEE